jgi:membrane-bound serine protease (ClpP class)
MSDEEGKAVTDISPEGTVLIHGEYWRATSDVPLTKGATVRVVGVEELKVKVEPVDK